MKVSNIIVIMTIAFLLVLSGCSNAGVVVEEEAGGSEDLITGNTVEEVAEEEPVEEDNSEEETTEDDSEEEAVADEEEEIVATGEVKTIIIDNFKGDPSNLNLKVGDTIKFINEQTNYKHIVGLREWLGTKFSVNAITGYHSLLPGDEYEYTFEESGKYQWLSKTKYPGASGEITVTEAEE